MEKEIIVTMMGFILNFTILHSQNPHFRTAVFIYKAIYEELIIE